MVHFLELCRGVVILVEHKAIIQTTLSQFTEILRHEVGSGTEKSNHNAVCRHPFLYRLLKRNSGTSSEKTRGLIPELLDCFLARINSIIHFRLYLGVGDEVSVSDACLEKSSSLNVDMIDFAITSISWFE